MNSSIPKWIVIVAGLISILSLFVGASLYLSPGTFIDNVDFSSIGNRYLAYMWAARQIAIAAIIGFSIFRKSAVMLRISLIAYCLMNIQDVGIGIWLGDYGLSIGALLFSVISGSMIAILSKKPAKQLP
jgi:O-antigen ligase